MSDYIDREELMKVLKPFVIRKGVIENINAIPAADVKENIHGEWEKYNDRYTVCSNCNTAFFIVAEDYNFCPWCGADMRGEKDGV